MSIEWYRVYHGMPEDSKLKVIAKRCKQPMAHVVTVWLCVLDAASRHKTRGTVEIDSEQIAVVQDIDQKVVESILLTFRQKGMIDAKNRLTGWDKRQYVAGAERSKKHRDATQRDVTQRDATERTATPRNVTKRKSSKKQTDTEADFRSEAEAEQKTNSNKNLRAREEREESERGKPTNAEMQILQQMLEIWNAEVQVKLTPDQKAKLTPKRQEQMLLRWTDDFEQDMRAWRHYCEVIRHSEFCLGKLPGKGWTIELSWAVESSDHVAKILEGGFSGGHHPTRTVVPCEDEDLLACWQVVFGWFCRKYGEDKWRAWLSKSPIIGIHKFGDSFVATMRCPSKFVQEWITQHFLADLTRWLMESTIHDEEPVTRIEICVAGAA